MFPLFIVGALLLSLITLMAVLTCDDEATSLVLILVWAASIFIMTMIGYGIDKIITLIETHTFI